MAFHPQPGPVTLVLEPDNYEALVNKYSEEGLVVILFWAPWCGHCRRLIPLMEELVSRCGEKTVGCRLALADVRNLGELAEAVGIQGLPSMLVYYQDEPIEHLLGAPERDFLVTWLDEQIDRARRPPLGDGGGTE